MPIKKSQTVCILSVVSGLFVLAGLLHLLESVSMPHLSATCFVLSNLIYVGLALAWGFSIAYRILHSGVRRYLMLCCATALLWLLLRVAKCRFFTEETASRYLWYLYYVPQVLVPLFSLYAALQMGCPEGEGFSRKWFLLFIPAGILIFAILTNDLHHMMFEFRPNSTDPETDHTCGWIYYLTMLWIIGLFVATGFVIYRKCRVPESRRRIWIPTSAFMLGCALFLLSTTNINPLHEVPECVCLTFAAVWECFLQAGLVPSNRAYYDFFRETTLQAQIVDTDGFVLYRTKYAPDLSRNQIQASAQQTVYLDKDRHLHSNAIRSGRILWVDNVSEINQMQMRLEEIISQLSEVNDLIRAENELKQQQIRIEEKKHLLDDLTALVQPELALINRLLNEGTQRALKQICILGAYIKRRINLALICHGVESVSVEELAHCIRESLTYLTQDDIVCAYHQEGNANISAETAQAVYDFFEFCVEAALPGLTAMMVRIECAKRFSIRLIMEDVTSFPDFSKYQSFGKVQMEQTDAAFCVTFVPESR